MSNRLGVVLNVEGGGHNRALPCARRNKGLSVLTIDYMVGRRVLVLRFSLSKFLDRRDWAWGKTSCGNEYKALTSGFNGVLWTP